MVSRSERKLVREMVDEVRARTREFPFYPLTTRFMQDIHKLLLASDELGVDSSRELFYRIIGLNYPESGFLTGLIEKRLVGTTQIGRVFNYDKKNNVKVSSEGFPELPLIIENYKRAMTIPDSYWEALKNSKTTIFSRSSFLNYKKGDCF